MSLDEAIDQRVLARTHEWNTAYVNAKPFPHVVIDDFLASSFAEKLLTQFPSFERGNNRGDDGKAGNKSTFEKVRGLGTAYVALDDLIKSATFLKWIEA